jgi:hypothetical protein
VPCSVRIQIVAPDQAVRSRKILAQRDPHAIGLHLATQLLSPPAPASSRTPPPSRSGTRHRAPCRSRRPHATRPPPSAWRRPRTSRSRHRRTAPPPRGPPARQMLPSISPLAQGWHQGSLPHNRKPDSTGAEPTDQPAPP